VIGLPPYLPRNQAAAIASLESRVAQLEVDLPAETAARVSRDDEIVAAYNSHWHGLLGLAGMPNPEVDE
jgi:hypothetical protein